MKKIFTISVFSLIAVAAGVSFLVQGRSEIKSNPSPRVVRPLSPISIGRSIELLKVSPTQQELKSLAEIRIQLRSMRSNGEPDVQEATRQILPLLRSSNSIVNEYALHELGRLESSEALPILLEKANELENARRATYKGKTTPLMISSPSDIPLRIAIARIQTRNLRGQERLNAIAKSLGMKWEAIVALSKQDNQTRRLDLPENIIVEEMVDVLYGMAKKGEEIESLSSQFQLSEPQKIKLEASSLPADQEAQFIVKYFVERRGAVTIDVYRLAMTHLTSLGEPANAALFSYFDKVKVLTPQERPRVSYLSLGLLLQAAAQIGDPRLISMLDQLDRMFVEQPKITNEILLARQSLKMQQTILSEE